MAAESPEQIGKTLQYARQNHHSVTFRASGSSLNGQSQGDDILIDVRKCFVGLEVLENGLYAKIKPGTIVSAVNRALLPYNRVLGPDPASSGIATVGGHLLPRMYQPYIRRPEDLAPTKIPPRNLRSSIGTGWSPCFHSF